MSAQSGEPLNEALQLLKDGRAAEAADLLKDFLWRVPGNGTAYALLGVALSSLGEHESALQALEQGHYLEPGDAGILFNYGVVLEAAGRPVEARLRFSAALKVDPGYSRAWQRMAQIDVGHGISPSLPEQLLPRTPLPTAPSVPCETVGTPPDLTGLAEPSTGGERQNRWVREGPGRSSGARPEMPPVPGSPGVETPVPPGPVETAGPAAAGELAGSQPSAEFPGSQPSAEFPGVAFQFRQPQPPPRTAGSLFAMTWSRPPGRIAITIVVILLGMLIGLPFTGLFQRPEPPPPDPLVAAGLTRGKLEGATVSDMDLTGVDLSGESLRGLRAIRTSLMDANLSGARLQDALLRDADLSGARMQKCDLARADLSDSRLGKASLEDSWLRSAVLRRAQARGVNLTRSYLSGAELDGADLREARLQAADLRGAGLRGARLDWADLSNTRLEGAVLSGASLRGVVLRNARFDNRTKWPAGFSPKAAGAVWVAPPAPSPKPAAGKQPAKPVATQPGPP